MDQRLLSAAPAGERIKILKLLQTKRIFLAKRMSLNYKSTVPLRVLKTVLLVNVPGFLYYLFIGTNKIILS